MYENTWYSASEILMAMTIFKDEFNIRFSAFFGILLVGKLAHGLLRDRLDYVSVPSYFSLLIIFLLTFFFIFIFIFILWL